MTYPPTPGGWQDPAGGAGDPAAGPPTYIDPATGEPATINPAPPSSPAPGPAGPGGYPPYPVPQYPPQYPNQQYPNQQYPAGYGQPGYDPTAYTQPGYQPNGQPGYGVPGYGYQQQPGGYAPTGYPMPIMVPTTKNNGLAIASMVVSLAGLALLLCDGVGGVAGLVGAILGHVARRQLTRRGDGGGGMALTGIIVGWIVFVLGVVIVVLLGYFVHWSINHDTNFGVPDPTFS